jgi:DHA2 family multidrug resistance protein
LTLVSIVSLAYFGVWNFFQKHKVVDFTFFAYRNFAFGTIAITIGYLLYFASTVTIPLWLQTEQNYTAFWAGVAVAPIGIAPVFLATTVGKVLNRFDLRLMASLSFFIFALGFFYQANFTTQVDLRTIMLTRFFQGFGIVLFFLPLTQISLGEIPQERYASASGLFHFLRILIGSGFGTSLTIEFWNHFEIYYHSRLGEAINNYNPNTLQLYDKLGTKFDTDVINHIVDRAVEQQAFMLSTNDLSWLSAWLFIAMIPLVYLCKRVKPKASTPAAAH